jgi:hypothetical protein
MSAAFANASSGRGKRHSPTPVGSLLEVDNFYKTPVDKWGDDRYEYIPVKKVTHI